MALTLGATLALTASPAHGATRWSKPQRVFSTTGSLGLVVDGRGAVIAVGSRVHALQVRRRTSAGRWLAEQRYTRVGSPVTGVSAAAARDGQAIVAFSHRDSNDAPVDAPYHAYAVVRGRSGPFSSPFALPMDFVPSGAAMDDAARAVIAGVAYPSESVVAVRRAPDGTLTGQVVAESGGERIADDRSTGPVLSMGSDGRAVLAWVRSTYDGLATTLFAAFAAPGEPFGTPQEIARSTVAPPPGGGPYEVGIRDVRLAVNPRGEARLAWFTGGLRTFDSFNPGESDVMAARAPADAGFSAPQTVAAKSGSGRSDLRLTLDARGRALLLWRGVKPPCPSGRNCRSLREHVATASSGRDFGSRTTLPAQYDDQLASDSTGRALLAYRKDVRQGCRRIVGRLRVPGGSFGRPFTVFPDVCMDDVPSVAGGGNRTFAVGWRQFSNGRLPGAYVTTGRDS